MSFEYLTRNMLAIGIQPQKCAPEELRRQSADYLSRASAMSTLISDSDRALMCDLMDKVTTDVMIAITQVPATVLFQKRAAKAVMLMMIVDFMENILFGMKDIIREVVATQGALDLVQEDGTINMDAFLKVMSARDAEDEKAAQA